MYGGGTHENLDGIDLDPHVDFNYDDRTGLHRRLDILVYLNREWGEAWGFPGASLEPARSCEQLRADLLSRV